MAKLYNRVKVTTTTPGTGTIALGAAAADFFTPDEAGVPNGAVVPYCIEEGINVEIGIGTYTTSGATLSRDTVTISKIGGVVGTSKISLVSTATVRIVARKEDLVNLVESLASQAQAEAGVSNDTYMSPLRTQQAIRAQASITFGTVAAASAATLSASVSAIATAGYATAGDGGAALYKRVGSAPSHSGKFQSADGAWWEIAEPTINLEMFGGFSTSSDVSSAWDAMLSVVSATGCGVNLTGNRFTFLSRKTYTMPNSAGWATRSNTSRTIGTGSHTFNNVEAGLSILVGDPVTAFIGTGDVYRMTGTVTAYSGTTLTINVSSTVGAGTFSTFILVRNFQNTAAFAHLSIRGVKGKTELYWPNASGGLKIIASSLQHTVDLDFILTTGTVGGGTGLELLNKYPFFGEFTRKSRVAIEFRGSDGAALTNRWTTCLDIYDWSNIDAGESMFYGASTPGGTGIQTQAVAGDYLCVFDFGAHFRFLDKAIVLGTGTQTVKTKKAFFGMCVNRVVIPAGGTNYQDIAITDSTHFQHADGDGIIVLSEVPNLVIADNIGSVHASRRDVYIENANAVLIKGNNIFPDTTAGTATCAIEIYSSAASTKSLIAGNIFAGVTIGVKLDAGSSGVEVTNDNHCTSDMTMVQDSGTNNIVNFEEWVARSAPATPAAGVGRVYVDSSDGNLKIKNDAGAIKVSVLPNSGSSNSFVTSISASGVVALAQPSFSNISGVATPAQGGTGVANNASSTLTISGSFGTTFTVTATTSLTLPTSGTLATLAGAEELTNKTLNASVGKGTWTASGTWTLPAHTLSGNISGANNAIDNIQINPTTRRSGGFTTLIADTSLLMGAASTVIPASFVAHNGTDKNIAFGTTAGGNLISSLNDANSAYASMEIAAAGLTVSQGKLILTGGALTLKTYTVATLPAGATGDTVYATNCRVFNGAGTQEGAGVGTGGAVNYNGSAWKIAGTNVTAVA